MDHRFRGVHKTSAGGVDNLPPFPPGPLPRQVACILLALRRPAPHTNHSPSTSPAPSCLPLPHPALAYSPCSPPPPRHTLSHTHAVAPPPSLHYNPLTNSPCPPPSSPPYTPREVLHLGPQQQALDCQHNTQPITVNIGAREVNSGNQDLQKNKQNRAAAAHQSPCQQMFSLKKKLR